MPTIPIGGILYWSGSAGSIPSGYQICDGTNGTPDLRDRFVPGAGGSLYAVGDTGGSATFSLATHDHLPQSPTYGGAGPDFEGAHSHPFSGTTGTPLTWSDVVEDVPVPSTTIWSGADHTHPYTGDDTLYAFPSGNGHHTHTTSGAYADEGPFVVEQRPPWWALYFIQRLA